MGGSACTCHLKSSLPMSLDIPFSLKPMEARSVESLPEGEGWRYEPKYDGFRAVAFRDGATVAIRSRTQKALGCYFPKLVETLLHHPRRCFVLDGEILLAGAVFETLQLRLHPAASRIDRLSRELPATFVAFDLLADEDGASLLRCPFADRRLKLERMMEEGRAATGDISGPGWLALAASSGSCAEAMSWIGRGGQEGVMAKQTDLVYQPGKRCILKYKRWLAVDCVVAGIYWKRPERESIPCFSGSTTRRATLHYVGRAIIHRSGEQIAEALQPLLGGSGFTGRKPTAENRWSGKKQQAAMLDSVLVVEVTAALSASGGKLVVVDPGEAENELVQDMIDLTTSFSARLYGQRSAHNRAKRTLKELKP